MRPGAEPRAAIVGIAGPVLTAAEQRLLTALRPAGIILFARNCRDPEQLAALVASLKALAPHRRLPVLIDQEGGRVMRLRPPHWRALPAAGAIGRLAADDRAAGREAAWLLGRLIAHELHALGIAITCAPVLDVARPGTTEAIGDRAFGSDPALVAELAAACLAGLAAGGVAGVVKHVPGHGRAELDSHLALPRVTAALAELEACDLVPFRALRHAPFAMTAHVVYAGLDPEHAATLSRTLIAQTVRGWLGLTGLLLSDDLAMQALEGPPAERALAALAAGCDLALYCPGVLEDNAAVLAAVPPLAASLSTRLEGTLAAHAVPAPDPFAPDRAAARLAALLAGDVA